MGKGNHAWWMWGAMDAVLRLTATPSVPFRLQGLLVDPESGAVSGSKGTVRIEPRAAALLIMLARTPGELVSRQALLDEIWPGGEISWTVPTGFSSPKMKGRTGYW